MKGSPRQIAARLEARARKAPARLNAQALAVGKTSVVSLVAKTPRDTGAAARSWRVVRGPRGPRIENTRPRSRLLLRGGLYATALRELRRQFRQSRKTIARALKEA